MFGAIGSAIGAIAGSALAHEQSKSLNRQEFEYNKTMYQNRYQWGAKDAEKAGFNPAIVAGGGAGNASTSAAQSGHSPVGSMEDMISALTSAEKANTEIDLNEAQKGLLQAQTINTMKEGGWIDDKAQKHLEEAASRIMLNKSTSALNAQKRKREYEETKKLKGGWASGAMGTDVDNALGKAAGFASAVPAIGMGYKAYKAYKNFKALRGASRFLSSLGR